MHFGYVLGRARWATGERARRITWVAPSLDVTLDCGGVLAQESTLEMFQSIKRSVDVESVTAAELGDLKRMIAVALQDDPDLPILQLCCGQAHLVLFKRDRERSDGDEAVRLAREVRSAESIPEFVRLYERARVAYEVGRRVGDPLLLEESVHHYLAARELQPPWSRMFFRLGAQLDEARDYNERAAYAGFDPSLPVISMLDVAIESVPVVADCWRRGGLLRRRPAAAFGAQVLSHPALITFEHSPQRSFEWMGERVDSRGREVSGWFAGSQLIDDSRVSGFRIAQSHPGDINDTRNLLKSGGRELYLWGERVNRWCDILSQKTPEEGIWSRQNYTYGYLYRGDEKVPININGDEPGITHQFSLGEPYRLSRFDLSFILNELAGHGVPVSLELMRSAQNSLIVDDPRRAVIEAGTAAESALAVLYDSHDDAGDREARWTLGTLAREVSKLKNGLPEGETQATVEQTLVKPRNDAVHRAVVTRSAATDAVDAALRIVDHLFKFMANDVVALGSRLETLAPWLDEYQRPLGGYNDPSWGL